MMSQSAQNKNASEFFPFFLNLKPYVVMFNPLTKKCAAAKYCCHGYGDRASPTVKLIQFCV